MTGSKKTSVKIQAIRFHRIVYLVKFDQLYCHLLLKTYNMREVAKQMLGVFLWAIR